MLSLSIGLAYGQTNPKKEVAVTKSENGKAHVKIVINQNGKETVLDTTVLLDHGKLPAKIDKMITEATPGEKRIMIELDSTFRGQNFNFPDMDQLRARIDQFRKDMPNLEPFRGYILPDQNFMKDFNFNYDKFPGTTRMQMFPGMPGRIHKLSDEEFSQLRKKGVFTEKEDLAEQLDVRYANLTPCGADCYLLNFVSKEKNKIAVTLCDKDGKVISTADAVAVSPNEVNGRTAYSCLINDSKDKKFTFIKLSNENKLAVYTAGF